MSTRIENYIIYGFKLDEKFTNEFWESENYDKYDSYSRKENEVRFLTDGMNGNYTWFGLIKELDESEVEEINVNFTEADINSIKNKFHELYPDMGIPEIKLYFVPHWV